MKKIYRRLGNGLGLAIFFILVMAASAFADESKAACVFISVENNAWIERRDSTVKSSLKVGDVLQQGDRVVVNRGNRVQLAFDKECKNIVQIDGDAVFNLNSAKSSGIDLQKGKIFALLDNLSSDSQFFIATPAAIGAVRGTQYQVNTQGEATNFLVYRGQVAVNSREGNGAPASDIVMVNAGQKTSVTKVGEALFPVQDMNASEREEIGGVIQNIDSTRNRIDSNLMETWLTRQIAENSRSSGNLVKSRSSDSSDSSKEDEDKSVKGGKIVFRG